MAEELNSPAPQPNGAAVAAPTPQEPPAARPSLREVAEAAYDQLADDPGEPGAGAEGEPGQPAQPRDTLGRFAPKSAQPGEADGREPTQPREDDQGQQPPPHPAPEPGSSSEAPANWSAADRETFAKLTPEGREFLLRRHSEMEGDYQRRVQANARATEFTSALEPVFRDPVIAGSLQQAGVSPYEAIVEWGSFHRRAMSPNVQDRVHLLFDLAARMQIDPAVFTTGRSGPADGIVAQLSDADLKDPAIKFFADHIGRTSSEVQALRGQLQSMQRADQARQNEEAVRVSRWSIDTFAEEKGADGKLLRPDFDQVLDTIIELFRANPNRDLKEAYETARWMVPATRQNLIAAERASVEQRQSNQRAAQAVRSNVRGITSPVTKPNAQGDKKGLRATLEASADEVGM